MFSVDTDEGRIYNVFHYVVRTALVVQIARRFL